MICPWAWTTCRGQCWTAATEYIGKADQLPQECRYLKGRSCRGVLQCARRRAVEWDKTRSGAAQGGHLAMLWLTCAKWTWPLPCSDEGLAGLAYVLSTACAGLAGTRTSRSKYGQIRVVTLEVSTGSHSKPLRGEEPASTCSLELQVLNSGKLGPSSQGCNAGCAL